MYKDYEVKLRELILACGDAQCVNLCVGGVPWLHHSAVPSNSGVNSVYRETVQIFETGIDKSKLADALRN